MHPAQTKVRGVSCGAYVLVLRLREPARLKVGALGSHRLKAGLYLYVGSARRGIEARVGRHKRLAATKSGKAHWHVDYLLLHSQCRLVTAHILPETEECMLSRSIAERGDAAVPIAGFGSTDCRSGCGAHLYQVKMPVFFPHLFGRKEGNVASPRQ
jgi:Uri superfamily endonuclease